MSSVFSRVLLVEGVDDKHVVSHICNRYQCIPHFKIADKSGFSELVRSIVPEINVSGRLAVGILADANDDPNARWQAIAYQLREANVVVPSNMSDVGTVIENRPRVGVWLMPDNQSSGELENFVSEMIPVGDAVWPMAVEYVEAIRPEDRKFHESKVLRAKIHAWLAAREEPRKMGSAIYTGDLDTDIRSVENFVNWLRRLFG